MVSGSLLEARWWVLQGPPAARGCAAGIEVEAQVLLSLLGSGGREVDLVVGALQAELGGVFGGATGRGPP